MAILLPVRAAVLKYLFDQSSSDVKEIMAGLQPIYGSERQFTKQRFLDHVMSLEANGLINEISYDLDENGELNVRYQINDEGISTIKKYVLKQ